MNERYIIDAYAWIEYLAGSKAGEKVKSILEEEGNEVFTCAVTIAEVVSKIAREGFNFEVAYNILVSNSQIINVDADLSRKAGIIHSEMRKIKKDFGLADAYVLAAARKMKLKILTGDPHFKDLKEAIFI